jgi:ABC-type dipeptide/oligopeptide/nickel transport system permease component
VFRYIVRRILISIPLLIVGSFLVFSLVQGMGDPLGEWKLQKPRSPQEIELAYERTGYNDPFLERYVHWAGGFVTGDWGSSVVPGSGTRDVQEEVIHGLWTTARLVIGAEVLALLIGMAVGVIGAVRQYSIFDYSATGAAFVLFSMPVFCIALMLKSAAIPFNDFLQSIGLERWITTAGPPPGGFSGSFGHQITQYIGTFMLPTISLLAIQDYVRTAQAKGLSSSRVVFRHAFRNGLIPVITVFAVNFGQLVGGAVITESVFNWSGMGRLLIRSINEKEPYMVLGVVMVTAIAVIISNLIADILYAYLDPRIRLG